MKKRGHSAFCRGLSPQGTVPRRNGDILPLIEKQNVPIFRQRGYVLFTVVVMLVFVAVTALLVSYDSSLKASMPAREAEASRADYVAQAGIQHAQWQNHNNACAGDFSIPTTALGQDNYAVSVTGGGATTAYTLSADQDAWIRDDQPTNNKGGDSNLHIKDSQVEQPLYRFDLSSLPAGAQINSAVASFYVSGEHPEGPVTVHRITAGWTEAGVTWDNINGSADSQVLAMIPAQPDKDVRVQVNITAQVQAWVNGEPNNGILLASSAIGIHAQYVSREGAANQQPRLDVLVGTGSASPVSIMATGTLANGVTRTLNRPVAPAYQPPGIVTLQLGTDPGADTLIDSFYPRNYGGADYLQVNGDPGWLQRPLLRFDLAGIPARASVLSARLELSLMSVAAPGTATVHRVARSWVEGTQNGGGTADGATWATYDGTNNWTSAGGDFNASAVAETAIDSSDTWVAWEIGPLVEQWLADAPNDGLLIQGDGALRQVRFASQENTNLAVQPKLTITYACECGSACMAPQGSGNVLLVVADPASLLSVEAYKKNLIESWGYTVTLIDDNAAQATFDTEMAANDVVYVSASVSSGAIGGKLTIATIGIVNEEGAIDDNLGFSSAQVIPVPVGDSIDITDTSHYISQPFPAGLLKIYAADMGGHAASGTLAAGLQGLANWGTNPGLAVIDTGAALGGTKEGENAAGRRVLVPFGQDNTHDWSKLNSNGRLVMQRALQWGTGNIGGVTGDPVILSTDSDAILGGLSFTDIDLAEYDPPTDTASLFFDGSLTTLNVDIDAVHVLANGHIVLSPKGDATLGGLSFEDGDLVDYDPVADTATLIFDGSALFTDPSERIISVHVLDNGHFVLSTDSDAILGGLSFTDIDLVEYDRGTDTASLFFDGSLTTLNVDIAAVHVLANDHIVLSTKDNATLGGLSFEDGDLVDYDPVADTATLIFDGSALFTDPAEEIISAHVGPGSGAVTGGGGLYYLDEFNAIAYNGNDGTLDWTGDWQEGGEFDGPTAGKVMVVGDRMRIWGKSGGGESLTREADLSGTTTATLTFDYQRDVVEPEGSVTLQVSGNGGGSWTSLKTYNLTANDPVPVEESFDITAYIAANTQIRFLSNGGEDDQFIYFDDVQISIDGASGGGGGQYYLDELNAIAYNGNDGSLDWTGNWQEVSEADGPTAGFLRVANDANCTSPNCLRIGHLDSDVTQRILRREADLSSSANWVLSYDYQTSGADRGFVHVEVSGDGGSNWSPLTSYDFAGGDVSGPESFDLTGFIASDTQIRIRLVNREDNPSVLEQIRGLIFIDDLKIEPSGGGGGGGGGSCSGTFRDEFNARSFAGTDGTLTWAGDWLEVGESNGATSGDIQVMNDDSNYQLRTRDNDNGGEGVEREADLTGAASATLSYDYRRMNLDSSSDYTSVEISANGAAGPWTELVRHQGSGNDSSYQPASHNINGFISGNTRIRFKTSSSMGGTDTVWFDNIEIACSP